LEVEKNKMNQAETFIKITYSLPKMDKEHQLLSQQQLFTTTPSSTNLPQI
jgi:hypothetical protein